MIPPTLILQVLIFISMLLLGLAILLGVLVWIMSQMLIEPTRMNDGKAIWLLKRLSPGDLHMPFEEVSFDVLDEQTKIRLRIAAWWIPAGKDEGGRMKDETSPLLPSSFSLHPLPSKTVIILHGFADGKVGAIAWAPLWRDLGYNILAVDLRAHGESGGQFTTAGFFERFDLDQVINEWRALHPNETKEIVLFGISLGAAVSAAVAERRDDLTAIILDSPYHHYAAAAIDHARYMNLPFGFLAPIAVLLGQWRSHVSYGEVAPQKTLRNARCPVLIMMGEADPLVSVRDVAGFEKDLQSRKDGSHIFKVAGAGHVLGIVANPMRYREETAKFLSQATRTK